MAEDANANIRIDIDTSEATAALKALQGQIARFHTEMARGGAAANQVASKLQNNLINSINAGGQFQAGMTKVQSTTEAFTTALEKNKLSMGQYFRYAGAATKTFGRMFGSEFQTITKVATERVKDLQTQYISMGRDANGALQSIKVRPLVLDMKNLTTQTMIAAQKQQLYNQLLKQGSTNLLNFGKNTQWAGRQLMVGFTIPLTMFAASAAKSFMDIEKQIIKIRRVYGDFSTTVAQTDEMVESIRTLASEYTKYGVAVKDTIELASEAAAAGKTGQELLAQIAQATRLAVLGNVEQTQALETTMSVTNAFGTATEDLAKKIDFLNAVENQSVTSIEDLTIAIPKAGPVVQQLGGDVEDLAFFLTAMKEGGINASEGANALKSGLAALINPTGKAKEMLNGFGINIEKIVNSNKGDIKGLVVDFASALDTLDPLSRARAIEQLFGKFQFSRLSTLFQNVIGEGTQASRVLELTKATTQELAILSQRELKRVEDTTTYKFEKAFADFQNALAPVGEEFLKVVTPIIEFGTKLLQQFNSMGDGAKSFTVILTTVVAGIGPALLMTVGLVANGVANLIKMFAMMGNLFRKTGGDATGLGVQTDYMTQQQIEAAAVAASLGQSHSKLTQVFSVEAAALNSLTMAYQKAITAQKGYAVGNVIPGSAAKPKKYANGGVVRGPGSGTSDSIPAMLSNGEAVIPAKQVKKYGGFIQAMISGNIPGFAAGGFVGGIANFFKSFKNIPAALKYTNTNGRFSKSPYDVNRWAEQDVALSMNAKNDLPVLEEITRLRTAGKTKDEALNAVFTDPRFAKYLIEKSFGKNFAGNAGSANMFGGYSPLSFMATSVDRRGLETRSGLFSYASYKSTSQKYLDAMKDTVGFADRTGASAYVNSPLGALGRFLEKRRVSGRSGSNLKETQSSIFDNMTPQEQSLYFAENAVHRSNKDLSKLLHPKDVPVDAGRMFGPGTYFAQNNKLSDEVFHLFGDKKYKMDISPEATQAMMNSKGYLDEQKLMEKLIQEALLPVTKEGLAGSSRRVIGGGTIFKGLDQMKWDSPLIQKLIGEGYLGYKHGDALTNWMVGTPGWGLKKYANGVVSVPGPKGAGDVVPAMLSPGEAVIPTKMAKKYGGLINGMVSGNIPGYENGLGTGFKMPDVAYASQSTKNSINQILDAISSGAIKIEQAEKIVAKTMTDLGNETKISMRSFIQRLAVNSEEIANQSVSNQINKFYQNDMGRKGRLVRYSATGVGSIEKQMAESGRLDELNRAKMRLEAERSLGLPGQIQIDRAHRVPVGTSGKLFPKQAFTAEAFNPQTHSENAISNALAGDNRVAGFMESYSKNLKGLLDENIIDQKQYNSILEKAKNNLALSETELATQAKVLGKVVATEQTMLLKNQALSNDIQRVMAGSSVVGGLAVGTNAGQITAEAKKIVLEDLEAAKAGVISGVRDSTKQASPSKEAYDSGVNIGQGAINGIDSKIDDAAKAGEQLGQATVNGTQAGARRSTREQGPAGSVPSIFMSQRERDERKEMIRQRAKNAFGPKAKITKLGGKIAGGLGGGAGMMAASMGGMAVSMIPGLEMVGMGISVLGPMLMMLPPQFKAVAAALAGVVGITMSLISAQEEQRKKAIELANAQTMSINAVNQMSEDFGTVSATQLRQNKEDVKLSGVSQRKLSAGQQYVSETASGQALLAGIQAQQAAGVSTADIAKGLAANMATAVSQNVISKRQGQEIIAALGVMSGNSGVATGATNQYRTYTENLGKTAGMVATEDLRMIQAQVGFGARGRAGGSPELAAQAMNASGRAFAGVDAINAQYDSLVKQAETQKEINALEKQRTIDINYQKDIAAQLLAEVEKQKVAIGSQAFNSAFLSDIKTQFGEESDMYKTAQKINELKDGKFKTKLQMDFAGGNVGIGRAKYLIDAARSDKNFESKYQLSLNAEFTKEAENTIRRLKAAGATVPGDAAGKKTKKNKNTGDDEDTGSGGGGAEPVDPLQKRLDKRNAALRIIGLTEAKINKKYDERKKALEEIAKINSEISQQQRDQLDLADALSRGDIAAAARAAQQYRATSVQRAQEAQAKALEDAKTKELEGVSFGRNSRKTLEEQIARLEMRVAKRDYRKLASGGVVMPKYFANGGSPLGSDTVPAMLTPGEFVIKRPAVKNFGAKNLEAINSGSYGGNSVYNYSINVNAGTDASPEQIARAVSQNIKRTESYRLRGNKI